MPFETPAPLCSLRIKLSNNRCHDGAASACGSTGHSTIAGHRRQVRDHGRTTGEWDVAIALLANNLSSGVRHEVAYVIVSPVYRKEEKPAVSSAVAYRRMRSW